MSLIVFVHDANEGPYVLGRVLQDHGHQLRFIHLYAGQAVPADLDDVDGIVSMGGPMNVEDAPKLAWLGQEMAYLQKAKAANKPMVGICLGSQLIAAALGGEVKAMAGGAEIGWHDVRQGFAGTTDPILAGIPWSSPAFHVHGQEVAKLPADAVPLVSSQRCKIQAYRVGLNVYGFQYHFEWGRDDLEVVLRDPFITQTGHDPAAIRQAIPQHYDGYRRLGDRLCKNIAELLFPPDKR